MFRLSRKKKLLVFVLGVVTSLGAGLLGSQSAYAYGSTLYPNEYIKDNSSIASPSGQFSLRMQDDGNLVAYMVPVGYWATNTRGSGTYLYMQGDGNLVMYDYRGVALWNTGTNNPANTNASLRIQDDGNLVIVRTNGTVAWAANAVPTRLYSGQLLRGSNNWTIYSPDRRYRMVMQSDGSAVIYNSNNVATWSRVGAGTNATLEMQTDANLVLYTSSRGVTWSANKFGPNGSYLEAQNDGNFVIYTPSRGVLWTSNSDSSVVNPNDSVAQLAQKVLNLRSAGKIVIGDYSEGVASDRARRALASQQLEDLAAGRPAQLSNRCNHYVPDSTGANLNLMRFLVDFGNQHRYTLNSLFGQCHSAGSEHYSGRAVDFACGLDVGRGDAVGGAYNVARNFETCDAQQHWHYSAR